MLPNFLIIGAMKSGTTSLHRYLNSHPQVFMSGIKELDFFTEELAWDRGLGWYEEQFAGAGDAVAVGESSTSYSKFPLYKGVPERIAKVIPEAKIIYLVRHPIKRMRSQYLHEVSKLREPEPIEVALRTKPDYLDFSRYAMQIDRYMNHFDREQLLVVISEKLRSNRVAELARVCEFLGINARWEDPTLEKEYNPTERRRLPRPIEQRLRALPGFKKMMRLTPKPLRVRGRQLTTRPMDPEVKGAVIGPDLERELVAQLAEDVARLRGFVGPDFDGWGLV